MNGYPDLPAIARTASALGWDPDDIARNLLADGSMDGVERLDWPSIPRELAVRIIARGILAIADPERWQRVLDRLDMLPEIVWLENASGPDAKRLRQHLERFPRWGTAKVTDEHETSRWFLGFWNKDLPFTLTLDSLDRPRQFVSGESIQFVGMDLDGWSPERIRVHSHLGFKGCQGSLRASEVSAETLELDPDLDVEISDAAVSRVKRHLRDGLVVEYAPASTRLRWQAGTLDPQSVDPESCLMVSVQGKATLPSPLAHGTYVTYEQKGGASGSRLGFPDPIPPWNVILGDLPRLRRLPRGFRFQRCHGDVAESADLGGISSGLTGGSLYIDDCPQFEGLPERLEIPTDLRLRKLPRLGGLPGGLEVGGELSVSVARGLRFVKAGLRVGEAACFRVLPRWYRWEGPAVIAGNLRLVNCLALQALPDPLLVGGDMVLDGLPSLKALPSSLRVMGSLSVERSGVRSLPEGAWVGGSVTFK